MRRNSFLATCLLLLIVVGLSWGSLHAAFAGAKILIYSPREGQGDEGV